VFQGTSTVDSTLTGGSLLCQHLTETYLHPPWSAWFHAQASGLAHAQAAGWGTSEPKNHAQAGGQGTSPAVTLPHTNPHRHTASAQVMPEKPCSGSRL